MKNKHLHSEKALRAALFVLLLSVVGMTKLQAQDITFTDAHVKARCVANWDTNGDGELSYAEAAAVTDLGTVFYDDYITTFDELQYFTGLISIGSYAFYDCYFLTSIEIPNSVTSIGSYAFSYCRVLTSIEIPNSVTSIGTEAFYGCYGLTGSLVIPNSVTSIGNSAFSGCSGLTGNLTIPNSVTSIGDGAFRECRGLTSIEISNSVTSISGYAFCQCSGLTGSLVIPNSVTSIGNLAFAYCYNLTSIEIPNSVTSIGDMVFEDCMRLTSIEIPNSVTSIGDKVFAECTYLAQIIVDEGNTVYDSRDNCNAIINSSTNELIVGCKNTTIPNSVTSIGKWAFYSCDKLTSIEIPNSVTSIGNSAFSDCSGLTGHLTIPNSVTSIGNSAFSGCSGLTGHLTIPNLVTSIGDYAFLGCSGLTSLTIPASLTSVGEYAFAVCYGITRVDYLGDLSQWCNINYSYDITEGGYYCYYYNESYDLYIDNTLVTDLVIPETVTEIKDFAFVGCSSLSSLVIPNSVTAIGAGAFRLCRGLKSVTIGNSVTSIGTFAFNSCSGLTGNLTIPNSVTSIGRKAFFGCRGLTSLTIGNSVTVISPNAFTNCYGLTSMTVLAENPPVLKTEAFKNINKSIPVYVPCGSLEAYQNATGWNEFTNIQCVSMQTQSTPLSPGWNWYSTYIDQEDIDGLGQLENSIGIPNVTILSKSNGYVKSSIQNGTTVWRGQLYTINNEEMYKIGTNEACTATMEGLAADPANHPITIVRGWNWIGFPCSQSVSVEVALSGFSPRNNDMIKGINSYATYSNGSWSGTLNTLEPGQGYMYGSKSNAMKTLVFQTGRGEVTKANITPENNYYQPTADYADNMTVIAVVELNGEELRSEDYELAAFVGDECRGSVKLMYVEPIDRYVAFLTVFGDQEADMRFVLTNGENMNWSDDQLTFAVDGMSGTLTEPTTLRFGTSVQQDYVNIFPNPSNGVFNIEGKGIRRVNVVDAYGQVVLSKEVATDTMQIDLNGKAAGIYMMQVVTDNGITTRQLIKK